MNSLNDLLNNKADDLFITDEKPIIIEEKRNGPNQTVDLPELKKVIFQIKNQLDAVLRIINKQETTRLSKTNPDIDFLDSGERVIEGVFNGFAMVGPDGKEYAVPPNYASKSKLVEGDMMKLTITNNGSFIYKQIGPIEKKRLIGELAADGEQYNVLADGKTYKVLTAAVTFYKGKSGDEAIILVPKDSNSNWGAVENIISK